MVGQAFIELIGLLKQKGYLTKEEYVQVLDCIIEQVKQQQTILNRTNKQ